MKKIFLITRSNYPEGDANGYRFHTFAQMCEKLNYEPYVLCMGKDEIAVKNDPYHTKSFYEPLNGKLAKIKTYMCFMNNCIKEIQRKTDVKAVICSTMMLVSDFKKLQRFCYTNSIKLIYSAVEWYSPEQYKSKLTWEYLKCDIYHKKVIPDGKTEVIAISKYLYDYYANRGTMCSYIPAVMDVRSNKAVKELRTGKVSIMYAGAPGKKDYIGEVIRASALLNKNELEKIELKIIGITKEQLVRSCGVSEDTINYLSDSLKVYGKISREKVLHEYVTSDFSILIRPEAARYAKAGFPTKFAESLMTGTPVICNVTSDLADYCIDGENSLIVKGEESRDILLALRKAIMLSIEERMQMSKKARNTAENCFDYRVYCDELSKLFT